MGMLMLMLMLLLVLMLMLIGMLMRRLMLNLTLELMSKCVLMLMVMLMVMLSWVGGGGDGHMFFFDAAGTDCARNRATFGCFKPAEDYETTGAFSNRLCSTIASITDLFNLFHVVEITGDQQ